MKEYKELLAHYNRKESVKKQFLMQHLIEVAIRSKELGTEVSVENMSELIGLLHDFGKSSEEFQLYIKGKHKSRVNHSSAGAIMLDYISNQVYEQYNIKELLVMKNKKIVVWNHYKETLQYPILAHHGLYDIIDVNSEYRTKLRLTPEKESRAEFIERNIEFLEFLNKEYMEVSGKSIYDMMYKGFEEFLKIYENLVELSTKTIPQIVENYKKHIGRSRHFYHGALTRLLLSILKEADIYNSSNYYREHEEKTYSQDGLNNIWISMEKNINDKYKSFNNKAEKTDLDILRTKMSNEMYEFSQKYDSGSYKLDMPVGSGKTFASLRYALGNARKFNKKRIFYCTAFLSVLEQNASSIKEAIGDKYILEHHSNVIQDYEGNEEQEDKKEYEGSEYLKESWESPVILTTLVQLSNTMFKHRASNLRRFSKLINSVIIIDEIQSLPTKAIYNFNLMMNFLTKVMKCTVIHSTATSPGYDNFKALEYLCIYGGRYKEESLVRPIDDKEVFSRVNYYSLLGEKLDTKFNSKDLSTHIKEQLKKENSVLVVLNTKKAVKTLYEEFENEDMEVIYLTTNQCPKHRLDIIESMKKQLKNIREGKAKRKIICISTKLVEAGVDIDFDVAYRSLAGIDSMIQVGGRCNREGKKLSKGKLFIFEYEEENLSHLPDIRKQISASKVALKILMSEGETKGNNINIEKARKYYFHKLYINAKGDGNSLEYIIQKDDDTILNLLSHNPKMVDNYKNKSKEKPAFRLRQSFKTAALEFDLIKEETIGIIVQYKNEDIINRLYEAIESYDYYDIKVQLQRLQAYTINIRNISGYERYITRELEDILILSKEAYSDKIGLTEGQLQTLCF